MDKNGIDRAQCQNQTSSISIGLPWAWSLYTHLTPFLPLFPSFAFITHARCTLSPMLLTSENSEESYVEEHVEGEEDLHHLEVGHQQNKQIESIVAICEVINRPAVHLDESFTRVDYDKDKICKHKNGLVNTTTLDAFDGDKIPSTHQAQ